MEKDAVVVVSSSHHIFCSSLSSRALTICPDPMCVRLPTSVVVPYATSVASLRPTIRIVRAHHYAFYCQRSHFDVVRLSVHRVLPDCRRVPTTRHMAACLVKGWVAHRATAAQLVGQDLLLEPVTGDPHSHYR